MLLNLYQLAWRPAGAVIRRTDAQTAHDRTMALMRYGDRSRPLSSLAGVLGRATRPHRPTDVGGVRLQHPLIVAAGLVKGHGFMDESVALAAVESGRDVVPGWRSIPALSGPVEFGSFTRYPRLGNPGRVLWRDHDAGSMQNRVGLRNPGARAAAAYLRARAASMPETWGVNLAVSPGVTAMGRARRELEEAASLFGDAFADVAAGPAWLTLNLSCPNTEDDPHGTQSADLAHELCAGLITNAAAPVWVKIGPDLSDAQLHGLIEAFDESGIAAVVATNTWAQPVRGTAERAGTSGARLRPLAMHTVSRLRTTLADVGADIDIVACGGIMEGAHWGAFRAAGARAAMIYSAMVFRGPLAAALILRESEQGGRHA